MHRKMILLCPAKWINAFMKHELQHQNLSSLFPEHPHAGRGSILVLVFGKSRLTVANDVIISDSDGEANGIGVNLGYFWDEQVIEYERQISIVDVSKTINHDGKSGQRLEIIQNNFWYSLYPNITSRLLFSLWCRNTIYQNAFCSNRKQQIF